MQAILDIAIPFFALIFCGFAALRSKLIDAHAVSGLNRFVFFFALPALLFVKVAEAPLESLLDGRFFIAFYGVALVLFVLVYALARFWLRAAPGPAMLTGLGAIWTNSGYMGIPLLITAFGPAAALPAVLAVTFDNIITQPAAILTLEAESQEGGSIRARARELAISLSRNPLILAVMAGFAMAVLGLPLPGPVAGFGNLLGMAAAPCALFALGGSLAGTRLSMAGPIIALPVAVKLVVHPLVMALVVFWMLPLEPGLAVATTVTAALPTGASVFVIAERYGVHSREVSATVFLTHLFSVLTVSLVLVLFQ